MKEEEKTEILKLFNQKNFSKLEIKINRILKVENSPLFDLKKFGKDFNDLILDLCKKHN